MATDLEIVQTALVEFDKVRAGLAQLETTYKGVLFEVDTPKGMELAKAARQVLRAPRYAVEKIRKETKAPLLALGRKLDADAAAITTEIMKLEDPIDQQIKNEEDRKERERQAKIDAENARISGINSAIDAIRSMPVRASGKTSVQIAAVQAEAAAIVIDASFAEFAEQASAALAQTVAALAGLHAGAVAAEAEAARLAAEREELSRLRAAEEQRAQAERARIAEENRRIAEAQAAEFARQQAELAEQRRADAAAAEAERTRLAEIAREQERLAQIERSKLAEEDRLRREEAARQQAELDAQREQLRKDQEAAKPKPSVAATIRPSDEQIAAVVAEYFGVDAKVACQWLAEFGTAQAA